MTADLIAGEIRRWAHEQDVYVPRVQLLAEHLAEVLGRPNLGVTRLEANGNAMYCPDPNPHETHLWTWETDVPIQVRCPGRD